MGHSHLFSASMSECWDNPSEGFSVKINKVFYFSFFKANNLLFMYISFGWLLVDYHWQVVWADMLNEKRIMHNFRLILLLIIICRLSGYWYHEDLLLVVYTYFFGEEPASLRFSFPKVNLSRQSLFPQVFKADVRMWVRIYTKEDQN